jgi:hypothetical protein
VSISHTNCVAQCQADDHAAIEDAHRVSFGRADRQSHRQSFEKSYSGAVRSAKCWPDRGPHRQSQRSAYSPTQRFTDCAANRRADSKPVVYAHSFAQHYADDGAAIDDAHRVSFGRADYKSHRQSFEKSYSGANCGAKCWPDRGPHRQSQCSAHSVS